MARRSSMIATERVKSGDWLPPWTVAEHEARYAFASRFVRGLAVVDCASGNGNGAAVFLRHSPDFLIGIDVDQGAVDAANEWLGGDRSTFRRAEATSLPLGDSTADVFISLETIEHLEDDRGFLDEVARVLKPSGVFVCSTPNRRVTNPGAGIDDKPWNPFHVREYSPSELLARVEGHFVVEEVCGQNPCSVVRIAILDWIGRRVSKMLAVRFNQLWKCRWFLRPGGRLHEVRGCGSGDSFEYLVLVARRRAEV